MLIFRILSTRRTSATSLLSRVGGAEAIGPDPWVGHGHSLCMCCRAGVRNVNDSREPWAVNRRCGRGQEQGSAGAGRRTTAGMPNRPGEREKRASAPGRRGPRGHRSAVHWETLGPPRAIREGTRCRSGGRGNDSPRGGKKKTKKAFCGPFPTAAANNGAAAQTKQSSFARRHSSAGRSLVETAENPGARGRALRRHKGVSLEHFAGRSGFSWRGTVSTGHVSGTRSTGRGQSGSSTPKNIRVATRPLFVSKTIVPAGPYSTDLARPLNRLGTVLPRPQKFQPIPRSRGTKSGQSWSPPFRGRERSDRRDNALRGRGWRRKA